MSIRSRSAASGRQKIVAGPCFLVEGGLAAGYRREERDFVAVADTGSLLAHFLIDRHQYPGIATEGAVERLAPIAQLTLLDPEVVG